MSSIKVLILVAFVSVICGTTFADYGNKYNFVYYDENVNTMHCTTKYCALLEPAQWVKCCRLKKECCAYVRYYKKKDQLDYN